MSRGDISKWAHDKMVEDYAEQIAFLNGEIADLKHDLEIMRLRKRRAHMIVVTRKAEDKGWWRCFVCGAWSRSESYHLDLENELCCNDCYAAMLEEMPMGVDEDPYDPFDEPPF